MMKVYIFIFIALLHLVQLSQAADAIQVSGTLTNGFRVLEVEPEKVDNSFTVYRGDYIKFQYPDEFGPQLFSLEVLQYKGEVHPDPFKSPYFKMKSVGDYSFILGIGGGVIEVIDLVRPNYTELTADEAKKILENVDPFILDVRTPGEFEQLHIEGATLIPIQQFQTRVGELESRKHEDIFVYCATGNRSTVAAKILADHGFKRIYNLRYGVYDWARKGYPFKTGK